MPKIRLRNRPELYKEYQYTASVYSRMLPRVMLASLWVIFIMSQCVELTQLCNYD